MFLAKMLEGHSDLKMYYTINVFVLSIWRAHLLANVIQDGCFSTKSVGKTTFLSFANALLIFLLNFIFSFSWWLQKNSSRIWKWRNEIERGRLEQMFWVNERSDTFMSSSSTLESVQETLFWALAGPELFEVQLKPGPSLNVIAVGLVMPKLLRFKASKIPNKMSFLLQRHRL